MIYLPASTWQPAGRVSFPVVMVPVSTRVPAHVWWRLPRNGILRVPSGGSISCACPWHPFIRHQRISGPPTPRSPVRQLRNVIRRRRWRPVSHVPGVLFMMALGKTVDESVRVLAINNTGNPINVSDELTSSFERLMVDVLRKSRRSEAYLRAKAEYQRARG